MIQYINNYHLHLIAPAEIADADFTKFHTELNLALKFLKYSKDKEKLREIINNDAAFRSVTKKTADLMNVVSNAKLHYDSKEEDVDMCEAIEGIRNDARAEGIALGRAKGLEDGIAQGIAQGKAEGIAQGKAEGIAQGKAEGIAQGKAEGIAQGKAEGIAQGKAEGIAQLFSLVKDGVLTTADAAVRADMTVAEFEEKTKALELA